MINVADLPSDVPGKSWREVNAEMTHTIPLGALVEVHGFTEDRDLNGLRLFVVMHLRDCDQTPLYGLSARPLSMIQEYEAGSQTSDPMSAWYKTMLSGMIDGGYAEHSLKVIRLPKE